MPQDIRNTSFAFDAFGPSVHGVRLLSLEEGTFKIKSLEKLCKELDLLYCENKSYEHMLSGLEIICRSMNGNDLAKAALATCLLSATFAQTADTFLNKASPEDPLRPGWPKGAPDSKGGEFRPLDETDAIQMKLEATEKKIAKLEATRSFRSILKRVLTKKRMLRLLLDVLGESIPVVDIIAEADTIKNLTEIAEEIAGEASSSTYDAALAFAKKGPQSLQSLMGDAEGLSFPSYRSFLKLEVEKRYGPAGEGYEYHHVVEQGTNGGRFSAEQLQSTGNIIRLPKLLHENLNAFYGSAVKDLTNGLPFRDYLRPLSFEQQQAWGRWALQQQGIIK